MSKVIKCKVIVIGDSNVGKTSIINTIINEKTVSQKTTIEISSVTKEMKIENEKFKFEIWDTIGQERYHSVNRMFYLDSKICIIVYDITNKTSYENAIGKWLNDIQKFNNRDLIIGLAGNKCDLYEKENISVDEVKKFANSNNMIFKETTATSFDTIDSLINELVEAFCNKFKDNIVQNGVALSDKNVGDFKKKGCCQNSKMS